MENTQKHNSFREENQVRQRKSQEMWTDIIGEEKRTVKNS